MRLSLPNQLSQLRPRRLRLSAKTVAVLLLLTGFAVYWTGLTSPFMGDDNDQIIHNTLVHSLGHLGQIFTGGTFFDGSGKTQLTGVYYRPLMVASFAVLYSAFGPHPLAFHLFQLLVVIYGAFMVYMVLRNFLKPGWALAAALIFLVHPLNSQAVFSIPTLQDPLYFSFGMTAFWLLLRFRSRRALLGTLACLFLSLLSKETGVVFIGLSFLYLLMFNRRRLLPFTTGAVLAFAAYLVLKIHAVGLAKSSHIAPIDNYSLPDRLANIPALIAHYLGLAVFPMSLSSTSYWVYPLSLAHFWVPLMLIMTLVLFAVYLGAELHRQVSRRQLLAYVFFCAWLALGLLPHLQLIPLDMTACDTWFYVSMVGLLGALGILGQTYLRRVNPKWLLPALVLVLVLLGTRSSLRGLDWHTSAGLALADLKASPDNFVAEYQLALNLNIHGDSKDAEALARESVQTYPTATDLDVLGEILMAEKKFTEAKQAFNAGMQHQALYVLFQDEAALSVVSADPSISLKTLEGWAKTYPHNPTIWAAVAVAAYRTGNINLAHSAITKAHSLGSGNQAIDGIYRQLMRGAPIKLGT